MTPDLAGASGRSPSSGEVGSILTLADILDARAYEREREAFRASVIELKRLRRLPVGPLVTVVFENRTTMRFQVQEMARAEQMTTDEEIQAELDVYNALIPKPGELSLTLFVELTSDEQLREWLPKLVGIERSVELHLGGSPGEGDPSVVSALVEPGHESQLTRENMTASVHYVRLVLDPAQQERFRAGPVTLALAHPSYQYETTLADATRESLASDW
ncbi:MAG: DUF3501 family protein [Acidimicrobiales bacterium]